MIPNFINPCIFKENVSGNTPASGLVALYPKQDKKLYYKNDDGQEIDLSIGQNVYTFVNSNSGDWESTYSTVNSNSAQWAVDSTTDAGVRALTGNWQNTFTDFSVQSANNASVFTAVNSNSATNWNYQGNDVKSLTSNWQNTYTQFSTQSANNASVYSNVNANSASWGAGGAGIDTGVRALTGNWQNTYTNFSTQSANNTSVYSTVNSNSATWGTGGGSTDTAVRALTGNWQNTYTTVQANSSTWGNTGITLLSTINISNVATISFTIPQGYRDYHIVFKNIYAASTAGDFRCRMSINSGSSFIDSANAYYYGYGYVNNYEPVQTSNTYMVITPLLPVKNSNGVNGKFEILNLGSASNKPSVYYRVSHEVWNSAQIAVYEGAGYLNGLSAINAFQFYTQTGNLSAGVIELYGQQ